MILGEIRSPQGRAWSEAGNGGMVRARDKNSTNKKLGPSAFGGRALFYRGGAGWDCIRTS